MAQLRAQCLSAADAIGAECAATLAAGKGQHQGEIANYKAAVLTSLDGCGEPLVQLLQRQALRLARLYRDGGNRDSTAAGRLEKESVLGRLDDVVAAAYAKFYAFPFKDLPACWRQLYTDASILKFACLYLLDWPHAAAAEEPEPALVPSYDDATLDDMVAVLDRALVFAGAAGDARGRPWIDSAFELLGRTQLPPSPSLDPEFFSERPSKKGRRMLSDSPWTNILSFSQAEPFTPPVKCPVPRATAMSLEAFQTYLSRPTETGRGPSPLVISGLTDEWPARTTHPWHKPAYLLSRTFGGRRLVPVEVGRSYVDDGWGQRVIPFGEFLREYIVTRNEKKKTGYLAQHQLFTQLPQLRADIVVPDLCYTAPPHHPSLDPQPELDAPQLNAWLGPAGTITPLHTDPYHNLLAQVVGRKYVRLYGAHEGARRMRARGCEGGVDMANTSAVDVGVVEGWDDGGDVQGRGSDVQGRGGDEGEDFARVPYLDCILEPGDTLYIPMGWWHYVRGLSVSFSSHTK
ncbi:hypothetical protein B0T26DRAFT_676327 [Lasiosphaeria miniovina]|uniref:JmjC domain-containing protein n=1 Tax=Lasiosphaeria miniovina TaxID=1954250 RepID=A0AA40ALM0_9PEZI|nr:uncharacterized protein B0T26DRAFT_676327 [Lasiosphaeria miniovina]KAK0718123.1 hypothetical protein B0T26DRAFT_676327 [Lasiosphaeria miniovina]